MSKIVELFQQALDWFHADTIVTQLNTGAHIIVHGRLRVSAVVIDCDGRQHSLETYISRMADESL
jgi:phage gp46-like protein